MNRLIFALISAFILGGIILPGNAITQEKLSAEKIMEKVDNRTYPVDMTAIMTMDLIDKKGNSRTQVTKTYRMSDEKQIMWFLEPANVKGSSFLRISYDDRDDDMWLYLPAFGKVRRIATHAKSGNFMGSDFTYEDLGDRKLKDYKYRWIKEEEINGKKCQVIESLPNEDVSTDYSKIVSWIWPDADLAIKEEFYDKDGNLKKIKTVDLQKMDKYWVPTLMTMENIKSKHKTEMHFNDMNLDTGLDENIFKSNYMKRIH